MTRIRETLTRHHHPAPDDGQRTCMQCTGRKQGYLKTEPGDYSNITSVKSHSKCFLILVLWYQPRQIFSWINLHLRLLSRCNVNHQEWIENHHKMHLKQQQGLPSEGELRENTISRRPANSPLLIWFTSGLAMVEPAPAAAISISLRWPSANSPLKVWVIDETELIAS